LGGKVDEIYFWNRTLNNTEVGYVSNGITFDFYDIPEVPPALTIPEIYPISAVTLNGGTTKTLVVQFNATDTNGYTDLNFATASVSVTSGITTRTSSSCEATANYTTTSTITCNITMNFYDEAGNYDINATIKDQTTAIANNVTDNFFVVNVLDYVTQDVTYVIWATATVGTDDNEADNTITFTNGGNQDYTNFKVLGKNATGITYNDVITTDKFSMSNLTGQTTGQTYLVDGNEVEMSPMLNLNRHGASETQIAYFYLDIPIGLNADTYTSDSAWEISITNV